MFNARVYNLIAGFLSFIAAVVTAFLFFIGLLPNILLAAEIVIIFSALILLLMLYISVCCTCQIQGASTCFGRTGLLITLSAVFALLFAAFGVSLLPAVSVGTAVLVFLTAFFAIFLLAALAGYFICRFSLQTA